MGGAHRSEDGRFEVTSADVALWPKLGARCLRAVIVAIDRDPARISGSYRAMVMSTVTFFCIHPREPRAGFMLGLSQRCDEGHEDAELTSDAESVAATLEFLGAR